MEWAREMTARLNLAVNGEKDRIIAEYQALSGKSATTLYRIAAGHGFCSGRKERGDKGVSKNGINEQQLQWCSSLIQTSARQVKGTILPLSTVMEMADENGVIPEGQISESRLQAMLRAKEMNSTALNAVTPSIKMASLHPNHVHVFDASICIQYYLKSGKGLGFMDERDYRDKKPANFGKLKTRIHRLVLADHFSHQLFVRYYEVAGENARTTFDFLSQAWRGGHHEKDPFRGVPKFLLMDAGAANVAKGILELLKRLEIEIPKNMPHNPRRQGSAECAQSIVETHFEAKLRFEPATTIEELNANVIDWLVWWNGTRIHRRHGMTRTSQWLTIRQEELRDLPGDELLRDLYAEPEVERTVRSDNTITFRDQEYRVKCIEGIRPGKKVVVALRPYHWPQVAVLFGGQEYLVAPVGKLAGGFSANAAIIGQEYKAQPETRVQQAQKINQNLAFGSEPAKGALPYGGSLQVFGHQADKVAAVPMPRRGTPMEVERPASTMLPIVELLKRVRGAIGTIEPGLNRDLRAEFGPAIEASRCEEVVRAIAAGEEWVGKDLVRAAEG